MNEIDIAFVNFVQKYHYMYFKELEFVFKIYEHVKTAFIDW